MSMSQQEASALWNALSPEAREQAIERWEAGEDLDDEHEELDASELQGLELLRAYNGATPEERERILTAVDEQQRAHLAGQGFVGPQSGEVEGFEAVGPDHPDFKHATSTARANARKVAASLRAHEWDVDQKTTERIEELLDQADKLPDARGGSAAVQEAVALHEQAVAKVRAAVPFGQVRASRTFMKSDGSWWGNETDHTGKQRERRSMTSDEFTAAQRQRAESPGFDPTSMSAAELEQALAKMNAVDRQKAWQEVRRKNPQAASDLLAGASERLDEAQLRRRGLL